MAQHCIAALCLRHTIFLQLQNQDAHNQRLGIRVSGAAEVHNGVLLKQFLITQVIRSKNQTIDAIGQ